MSSIQFSPAQARFIYLFKGLAPVATNLVTPLMVMRSLRDKPLPEQQRREIVIQEVARQIVSGSIGLLSYFGGGLITGKLLGRMAKRTGGGRMGDATRQIMVLVGATLAEFIGYGFIRPLISTELIVHLLQRYSPKAAARASAESPAWAVGELAADERFRHFLQSAEQRSASSFQAMA